MHLGPAQHDQRPVRPPRVRRGRRGEQLKPTTILAGRTEWIGSTSDLTPDEATAVRDALKGCKSKSDLDGVLKALQVTGSQDPA